MAGDAGDSTGPAITPPSGFNAATGYPKNWGNDTDSTYGITFGIYTKIASSESGNYTFTHSTANSEAVLYNIAYIDATTPLSPNVSASRGGDYLGAPGSPDDGQTTTWIGLTAPNNNSLIIAAEGCWDDASGTTPPTGSTPTFANRYAPGASGILYVCDGVLATAGATGDKTHTNGNTNADSPWEAALICVQDGTSGSTQKFGSKGTLGANGTTTANQSNIVLTTATTNVAIGDLAVIVVAVDNRLGTADADDGNISGVVSNPANNWVKAREWSNNQAAAQAGATVSMWYTVATAAMNTGSTITASFTSSTTSDAQGIIGWCFTKPNGDVTIEATNILATDGADPAALDATTREIECLRIRGIGSEGAASGSAPSLTPTGGWTAWGNGNSAATMSAAEMYARAEHTISVGTGSSSNPTGWAADNASVYVAFAPPASLVFIPGAAMTPLIVR